MTNFISKIDDMARLEKNWDSYDADPPSEECRNKAKAAVTVAQLLDIYPKHVCPSAQGGIGLCWFGPERYADIEYLNDGEVLAVTSLQKNRDGIEVWEVTDLPETLERIRKFINT